MASGHIVNGIQLAVGNVKWIANGPQNIGSRFGAIVCVSLRPCVMRAKRKENDWIEC